MKKIFKLSGLLLAISILFIGLSAEAAKPFEGTITYKITYPGTELDPQMASMLPKVATVQIRDKMIKTTINMGMGMQATIYNSESNTSTSLIDMMGQKYAVNTTEEEMKEEMDAFETTVDVTAETKEIAGYKCKKAVVTVKDIKSGSEFTLSSWFTNELDIEDMNMINPMFKDIDGTMLQYEVEANGMTMMFTATDVDKGNVSKSEFEVPEDFKQVTKEELQSMFGGGM